MQEILLPVITLRAMHHYHLNYNRIMDGVLASVCQYVLMLIKINHRTIIVYFMLLSQIVNRKNRQAGRVLGQREGRAACGKQGNSRVRMGRRECGGGINTAKCCTPSSEGELLPRRQRKGQEKAEEPGKERWWWWCSSSHCYLLQWSL